MSGDYIKLRIYILNEILIFFNISSLIDKKVFKTKITFRVYKIVRKDVKVLITL